MFVGETGVQRVVKRACELTKQDPGGDPRKLGGIDLPTHPEVPEPVVLAVARSVRRRGLVERGRCVRRRHQGPLQGRPLRRAQAGRLALRDGRARGRQGRPQGRPDAQRAQRGPAHRVHQGLPARRRSLEQDDPGRGHRVRAAPAVEQVPPPDRHVGRPRLHPRRRAHRRRDLRRPPRRVAADRGRRALHQEPDAPGLRRPARWRAGSPRRSRASTACRTSSSTSGCSRAAQSRSSVAAAASPSLQSCPCVAAQCSASVAELAVAAALERADRGQRRELVLLELVVERARVLADDHARPSSRRRRARGAARRGARACTSPGGPPSDRARRTASRGARGCAPRR